MWVTKYEFRAPWPKQHEPVIPPGASAKDSDRSEGGEGGQAWGEQQGGEAKPGDLAPRDAELCGDLL